MLSRFCIVEISPGDVSGPNITPTTANNSVIIIDSTDEVKIDGECSNDSIEV